MRAKNYNQTQIIEYNYWMTHSIDFRHKVLSVREKEGLTIAEVA